MSFVVAPPCRLAPRSLRAVAALALALSGVAHAAPDPGDAAAPARATDEIPRTHLDRALFETLLLLVGGTAWYWRNPDFNQVDWELRWDGPSWRRKLVTFDAVRFDSNHFGTNSLDHTRAGTAYFQIWRSNGASFAASYAAAFATSTFWEYVVEFKELPSLNDLILTPVTGVTIGESFYQLGTFLRRGRRTVAGTVVATIVTPFSTVNDVLDHDDDEPHVPDGPVDRLGLPTGPWHRFELTVGQRHLTTPEATAHDEVDLVALVDLVVQPGYRHPGDEAQLVRPGAWSGFSGALAFDSLGVTASELESHAVLVGRYGRRYERDGAGALHGRGSLLGAQTSFDYEGRDVAGLWDHVYTALPLALATELTWDDDRTHVRVRAWAGPTFGMVTSPAYTRYRVTNAPAANAAGAEDVPTPLHEHGYYFAAGFATRAEAELRLGIADLRFDGRFARYESIDVRDRFQQNLVDPPHLSDVRARTRAGIGVRPYDRALRLSLELGATWRQSQIDGTSWDRVETTVVTRAGLVF